MHRKRPRVEDGVCQGKYRTQSRSNGKRSAKVSLLALPDEALSLIFSYIGACNTSGSFQGPRHAFALAQTNRRMLCIFSNALTRITPDTANPTPPALSPSHLLTVARLAGRALRELHLPDGCFHILPQVALACPRLEALSIVDNPICRKTELATFLCVKPLRALTINNPSFECFRFLRFPLRELTLNNILYLCLPELIPILRNPPLRLNLMVNYKGFTVKPWLTKLLESLSEAIPKMESICLQMPFCFWHPREDFANEAARLVASVRQNDDSSKCMSIKLEGEGIFQLLKSVHPKANIEITRYGQTYADYGDGLHPRKIVLDERYVTTDVSRLKDVIVTKDCNPQWKTALSRMKLEHVEVFDIRPVTNMCLSFDTVEMYVAQCRGKKWAWLGNSRAVYIVGVIGNVPTSAWIVFFEALESLLEQFRGNVVWIRDIGMKHFAPTRDDILQFRRAVRGVRTAVEGFEKRDGDAGTVKSLVDSLLLRGTADR